MSRFGHLLWAEAKKRGVFVEYSAPELVSGGLCPPPSTIYPGTICYMITLTVDGKAFYGFGPKPAIARHYAEVEAYLELHPGQLQSRRENLQEVFSASESDEEDEYVGDVNKPSLVDCSSLHPVEDQEERRLSCITGDTKAENAIHTVCQPVSHHGAGDHGADDAAMNSLTTKETETQDRGSKEVEPGQHQQPLSQSHEDYTASNEEHNEQKALDTALNASRESEVNSQLMSIHAGTTAREHSEPGIAEMPYLQTQPQYHIPQGYGELMQVLQKPPSDTEECKIAMAARAHTFVPSPQKDMEHVLMEVAERKGLSASFEIRSVGRQVFAKAMCGGLHAEGRHWKKKVAKAIAAQKLLNTLHKLPDKYPEPPPTSSINLLGPSCGSHVPVIAKISEGRSQAVIEKESQHSSSSDQTDSEVYSTSHEKELHRSQSRDTSGSRCLIFHNPVGQLQELVMKEGHDLPVYAESVHEVGKYAEYVCVASAKGLSAKGVGCSKKLARRHAVENLLAIMEGEGMNINPNAVETKSKKSGTNRPYRSPTPRIHPYNQPNLHHFVPRQPMQQYPPHRPYLPETHPPMRQYLPPRPQPFPHCHPPFNTPRLPMTGCRPLLQFPGPVPPPHQLFLTANFPPRLPCPPIPSPMTGGRFQPFGPPPYLTPHRRPHRYSHSRPPPPCPSLPPRSQEHVTETSIATAPRPRMYPFDPMNAPSITTTESESESDGDEPVSSGLCEVLPVQFLPPLSVPSSDEEEDPYCSESIGGGSELPSSLQNKAAETEGIRIHDPEKLSGRGNEMATMAKIETSERPSESTQVNEVPVPVSAIGIETLPFDHLKSESDVAEALCAVSLETDGILHSDDATKAGSDAESHAGLDKVNTDCQPDVSDSAENQNPLDVPGLDLAPPDHEEKEDFGREQNSCSSTLPADCESYSGVASDPSIGNASKENMAPQSLESAPSKCNEAADVSSDTSAKQPQAGSSLPLQDRMTAHHEPEDKVNGREARGVMKPTSTKQNQMNISFNRSPQVTEFPHGLHSQAQSPSGSPKAKWVPKLEAAMPHYPSPYSDPLNFTVRLPQEREGWTTPLKFGMDAMRPKPLLPPWLRRQPKAQPATKQASPWMSLHSAQPQLPPHPLLQMAQQGQLGTQMGTARKTETLDLRSVSSDDGSLFRVQDVDKALDAVSFKRKVYNSSGRIHDGLCVGLPTEGAAVLP